MNNRWAFSSRNAALYGFAIFASVALSFWIDYQQAIINPDAICYLLSAQMVGNSGINDAMHLCGQAQWPFYSVLIYGFVQLSHLSYHTAAYLIDGVFSLFSVLTFILIVKELGGNKLVLWLAAFVILLSHEFNSVREYIVRDHGFWAFYLASVLFLLRYFRKPSWQMAFAWNLSLMLGTLFRIEGAFFLLALPFLAWICAEGSLGQRAKSFFTLNLPTLMACAVLGIWMLLHPQEGLAKLGRVAEIPNQLQHGFLMMANRYQTTRAALGQFVLTHDASKDAGVVLLIVLFAWHAIYVIGNLSWMYAFLVGYAWVRKVASFPANAAWVLGGYLGVNFIITLGFLMERLFLSKRYLIAFSLILMLWVPFALNDLIQKSSNIRYRMLAWVSIFFIFITSLGGIIDFGYSKSYIRDAGNWLAANIPADKSLYANDYQLMYYSQHFGNDLFQKLQTYPQIYRIANGQWNQFNYLALRVNKKEKHQEIKALMAEMKLTPIQTFSNTRGDSVMIYKIR